MVDCASYGRRLFVNIHCKRKTKANLGEKPLQPFCLIFYWIMKNFFSSLKYPRKVAETLKTSTQCKLKQK